MKKSLIAAAAFAAFATMGAGAANAAPYAPNGYAPAAYATNVNQRQANIEMRINMGLRNGSLTRFEAQRLRGELRNIDRLEARYRMGGINRWERADLDRRLDNLSRQVRFDRHDYQNRRG
ncbi:MAG: hypothetical protein AB7M12_09425 [Hyphomonadaceae bacterium]